MRYKSAVMSADHKLKSISIGVHEQTRKVMMGKLKPRENKLSLVLEKLCKYNGIAQEGL